MSSTYHQVNTLSHDVWLFIDTAELYEICLRRCKDRLAVAAARGRSGESCQCDGFQHLVIHDTPLLS